MPRPSVFVRHLAILAASLGLAFALSPQTARAQASGPDVQVPDTADAIVRVRGMACSSCAWRMKSALEAVDGVNRATVRLETQDVLLILRGEKAPSKKALREAVTGAGYEFRAALFAEGPMKDGQGA